VEGEVYGKFRLLIRRRPKENNFKAVLESIMSLLVSKPSLPNFLNDIILGYSDEAEKRTIERCTLLDTFID
jgi:intron-binding protein aquarius